MTVATSAAGFSRVPALTDGRAYKTGDRVYARLRPLRSASSRRRSATGGSGCPLPCPPESRSLPGPDAGLLLQASNAASKVGDRACGRPRSPARPTHAKTLAPATARSRTARGARAAETHRFLAGRGPRGVGSDTFAMLRGISSLGASNRDNHDSPYLRGLWPSAIWPGSALVRNDRPGTLVCRPCDSATFARHRTQRRSSPRPDRRDRMRGVATVRRRPG